MVMDTGPSLISEHIFKHRAENILITFIFFLLMLVPFVISQIRRIYLLRLAESEDRLTEELRETNEILKDVATGISDGILLLSRDLKIIWANEAFLKQSGCNVEDVTGNYCYSVTHNRETPCESPNDTCPIAEIMRTGKPVTSTHTHFNKDGSKSFVEVTAYPVHNKEGEIVRFVHLSKDTVSYTHLTLPTKRIV